MFMVGLHMALMGMDNQFGEFKEVHIGSKGEKTPADKSDIHVRLH